MFLVLISKIKHIIECIFCFIEENPVSVGIFTSMIVGSLWFRKYIRQKRAEAFFGFYAKLSLCLKSLRIKLEENGQLNVSDTKAGNIYSLIYVEDDIKNICPRYKKLGEDEILLYQAAAKELKEILLNTDNNVYPRGSKRQKWYESQHIIFQFCEFLENKKYWHTTNIERDSEDNEYKHIKRCKLLIDAMDYVQESINNAKY